MAAYASRHRESREQQRARGWSNTIGFDDFESMPLEAIDRHETWQPKLGLPNYVSGERCRLEDADHLPTSALPAAPKRPVLRDAPRNSPHGAWGSLEDAFPKKQSPPALRDTPASANRRKPALRSGTSNGAIALSDGSRLATQHTASSFAAGMPVRIEGLKNSMELNGARGVLVDYDDASMRWHVDLGGILKALRTENLITDAAATPSRAAPPRLSSKPRQLENKSIATTTTKVPVRGVRPKAPAKSTQV